MSHEFVPLPNAYRTLQRIAAEYDDVNGGAPQVSLEEQLRAKRSRDGELSRTIADIQNSL